MAKLKVAIFCDNFYPGPGGTEKAVENLATGLLENDCEVMVCVPKYNRKKYDDSQFPFIVNRCKSIEIITSSFLVLTSFDSKFRKMLIEFKPDIIHCNSITPFANFAVKYCKKYKIPCVATVHSNFSYYISPNGKDTILSKFQYRYFGKVINKMDKVFTVSYNMKQEFKRCGYFEEYITIKNGLTHGFTNNNNDKNIIDLVHQKYGISTSDNILLFAGRVETIKNINFIFDSLEILYKRFQNFKMYFVGMICDKQFEKRVKQSPLSNVIYFTGNIDNKDILSSFYMNSKLLVFPSKFDTDGLVVSEAATFGVPSVVIKNTGPSERITNDKNGFIIDDDAKAMADKIEYLLQNQDVIKTVGDVAKSTIPKCWKDVSLTYKNEYIKTLNEKIIKRN